MAGAIGIVVGLTSLRVRHDFLAVTTMGIGFVFLGFVRKQKWLGGELGISGIPGSGLDAVTYALLISAFGGGQPTDACNQGVGGYHGSVTLPHGVGDVAYAAVILPLLGIQLPLVKTMVFITFLAGLLPVVGNLV